MSFQKGKGAYGQAYLQASDCLFHVRCCVLAEIDEADVAQLVAVVIHGRGVDRAQLQLLPLQPHLRKKTHPKQKLDTCGQRT